MRVIDISILRETFDGLEGNHEGRFDEWIVKADFPEDVKKIASDALRGKFPKKPKETDAK